MTTIGNRIHIVTLSSAAPLVTITGPVTAYGSALGYGMVTLDAAVYGPAAGVFTIWNQSSVVSLGTAEMGVGILLGEAGSVFNAGFVSGGDGVAFLDDGSATVAAYVENRGTILAYGAVNYGAGLADGPAFGVGVLALVASGVVNAGTIAGDNAGIVIRGAGSVGNTGTITASAGYGVYLQGAGNVQNSGTVYGYLQGVFIGDTGASPGPDDILARVVANEGVIEAGAAGYVGVAFVSDAIEVIGAGSVTNAAGATVADPGGNGVFLYARGTAGGAALPGGITNAGLIQGLYGVQFYGAGSVVNHGTIIGENIGLEELDGAAAGYNAGRIETSGSVTAGGTPSGVLLARAGCFTNASGGVVLAPGGDAVFLALGGTIENRGGITAGLAGILDGGSGAETTVNTAGTIMGGAYGIYLLGAASVWNDGFVGGLGQSPTSSTLHYFSTGVFLAGGPEALYNGQAGTIFSRTNYAVEMQALSGGPQAAALSNDGLIEGLGGVQFFGLGGLVNGGTIIATAANGIVLHYNGKGVLAGSVVNTGVIGSPLTAVYANGPAAVVNGVDGAIKGQQYGVRLMGAPASYLANSGYIGGNVALEVTGGSTVVNDGTLVGGSLGVALLGGGTLIDGGLIAGEGGGAVYFEPGLGNVLELEPGAEILGTVRVGGGSLQLAGHGTEGLVKLQSFAGFTALTVEAGAEWEFAGKSSLGNEIQVVNDGTIRLAAGGGLTIAGALTGEGTIGIAKAKLALDGSVAAGQVIKFTGSGETLSVGAAKSFQGELKNFKLGDTIDLTNVTLAAVTGLHFASGVLTLTEAAGTIEIGFTGPDSFGKDTFGLAAAGKGTDVILGKPGGAALEWPTVSWLPVVTL